MSRLPPEIIDVIVVPRDRFSMFSRCLEALYAHTDVPFRAFVIVGGADKITEDSLREFQTKKSNLTIVLMEHLLLQGEARNIGLQRANQRYCVVLENDTIVQKNWIAPMLECLREEEAAAVMPLVLWYERIHAAGCVFEYARKDGEPVLNHKILYSDIRRKRIDYPECHCILFDRKLLSEIDLFEDVEPFDVDLGLTFRKCGQSAFIEPRSVVTYSALPCWEVRDIPLFKFRWDPLSWETRNRMFMQKWKVRYDPSSKVASYRRQQLRLGFARWYPNRFTVGFSNALIGLEKRLLSFVMPGPPYAAN
jgi:glycosyltransferase involved in cell wall biosynthesis